jgi:hypothetical protein
MTVEQAIVQLKREILVVFGFDENLKYIGQRQPSEGRAEDGPLTPAAFLRFAIRDLADSGEERNRVNCLANCKRAIDSQVDALISRLGFRVAAKKEGWNLPKKVEFIGGFGIVAPRIVRRVVTLRNKMEHEFTSPKLSEVEDVLDVTTLFVSYCERVAIPGLNWTGTKGLGVRYDDVDMAFDFVQLVGHAGPETALGIRVRYPSAAFQELFQFLTKALPKLMEPRS